MSGRAAAQPLWTVLRLFVVLPLLASTAAAVDIKLWPLIDYHRDASGQRSLHLLGPLFEYEDGAERAALTLRPLFSYTRGADVSRSQFTVLYPLFIRRHEPGETTYRLLLLMTYRDQTVRRPDEWERRFTIFPFFFYRYNRTLGASLSVLPFYADLRDFVGYERIRMIGFPFYLKLQQPLIERTWLPFPFVSWTGGTLGHGWRIWPFYGWDQNGKTERFTYVMWPLYISQERHFTRPEHEHRLVVAPFYSHTESSTLDSRSYAGPFFTHTVDRRRNTDTWGFPWPGWISQRDLTTGQRTALRLAPFYEDTHFGDVHSHFILWPFYRRSTQDTDSYHYTRHDSLLVLYRDINEVQLDSNHQRRLRTLFPLFRMSAEDSHTRFSTLALLDALFPRNPTIEQLYAPLWQLYTSDRETVQAPRWSLLWDLISSDGNRLRYPIHLSFSEP